MASTMVLGFALDLLGIYLIMPASVGLCIFFRWDFDKVSISAYGSNLVFFYEGCHKILHIKIIDLKKKISL